MGDLLIDSTSALLGKVLDGTSTRQRVLAENIANAETPGYIRKDLTFESQLLQVSSQVSSSTPDEAISSIEQVPLVISEDFATPANAEGNNVEMEREMTQMAKNSLEYETAAQMLMMKMRALHSAIFEGRR